MNRSLEITATAIITVLFGAMAIQADTESAAAVTFTPNISGVPDIIIGDQTPIDGLTPGDILSAGDTREFQGPLANVFEFSNAFSIYDLVSDTADQVVSSGFTSDDSMLYQFIATPVSPPLGAFGVTDDRLQINSRRISSSGFTDATSEVVGAGGEITFRDWAFTANGDASPPVPQGSLEYSFGPNTHPTYGPPTMPTVTATADIIDLNVITAQVTNLQSNVASDAFLVYTVNNGPDAITAPPIAVPSLFDGWTVTQNDLSFFPDLTQDPGVQMSMLADDDGDGSGSDLHILMNTAAGDSSINVWQSPGDQLPFSQDTIYRMAWNIEGSYAGPFPTLRLRASYGLGALGSHTQVIPQRADFLPSATGQTYEHLIDLLDVSTATGDIGGGVAENSLMLALDAYEFDPTVGVMDIEVNNVTVQSLNRLIVLAAGTLERQVTNFSDTSQATQVTAGAYNPNGDITVDLSTPSQAAITTGPVSDVDILGATFPFALDGVTMVSITPAVSTGRFYRGRALFDSSENATAPLPRHILQVASTSTADEGLLYTGETVINAALHDGSLSPVHDANAEASCLLLFPAGATISDGSGYGDGIGMRLNHASFGETGTTIVHGMELYSYPESLLP